MVDSLVELFGLCGGCFVRFVRELFGGFVNGVGGGLFWFRIISDTAQA